MKTKLTLTIDRQFLPKAKKYAKSQGKSLSQLIETTLKKLTLLPTDSFVQKWKGRFKPAQRRSQRYRELMKHHS